MAELSVVLAENALDGGRALRHAQGMIRIVQIVLLIAIMVPFGWGVRWVHGELGQSGKDIWLGAVIGFVICYGLWRWHDRIKERQSAGANRGVWD